jgi:hypothetical protein
VSVDNCPMLKGQCLHALYVSSVHVSDQHQNKYKYSDQCVHMYTCRTNVPVLNRTYTKFSTIVLLSIVLNLVCRFEPSRRDLGTLLRHLYLISETQIALAQYNIAPEMSGGF